MAAGWDDVVRAAEKEGEVSVISPPVKPHRETLAQFQKAYPKIRLKLNALNSPQWEPRITSERKAGIYVWDVLVSGVSLGVYTRQIPAGWYQPTRDNLPPELMKDELWLGGFDSGFMDKGKRYIYGFGGNISNNWMIDRGKISKAELGTFDDFLKPQWKGKIAFYDPRHRGPGSASFAQAYTVMGPEKMSRFIKSQDIVLTSTPRQIVEWVVRGRYPIVVGASRNTVLVYQKQGLGMNVHPLDIPDRAQNVSPSWGSLMIFDRAPHPNAAKVYAAWLLSKEGQADWASRGIVNSRRLDVAKGNPEAAPTAEQWVHGMRLSSEAFVGVRTKAAKLAKELLKGR